MTESNQSTSSTEPGSDDKHLVVMGRDEDPQAFVDRVKASAGEDVSSVVDLPEEAQRQRSVIVVEVDVDFALNDLAEVASILVIREADQPGFTVKGVNLGIREVADEVMEIFERDNSGPEPTDG